MRLSLVLLSIFFSLSSAMGRSPAVEDFVGVEPESYKTTPAGTETLFNFSKNINQAETATESSLQSPWFSVGILVVFLGLPSLVWFSIRDPKAKPINILHPEKSAAGKNIHNLEDYRPTSNDDEKKAS